MALIRVGGTDDQPIHTIVDDDILDSPIFKHPLRLVWGGRYVVVRIKAAPVRNGRRDHMLHRVILGCPDHLFVDHINRNTLDNRLANLRACTQAQNRQNLANYKGSRSRYRGVTFCETDYHRRKPWQAAVYLDGKVVRAKYFATEDEAGAAAAAWRRELMPFSSEALA